MEQCNTSPVVSMSLIDKLYQDKIFDCFENSGAAILHVILEAEYDETLRC